MQSQIRACLLKTAAKGERAQPMVKVASPQDFLPQDVLEEKKYRNFRNKLLRKRKTYDKYFSSNLKRVDAALRRVAAHRSCRVIIEHPEGEVVGVDRHGSAVTASTPNRAIVVLVEKVPLKECGRKEKEKLRKYATSVLKRRQLAAARVNERLAAHRAKRAKAEKIRRESPVNVGVLNAQFAAERERRLGNARLYYTEVEVKAIKATFTSPCRRCGLRRCREHTTFKKTELASLGLL